MRWLLLSLILVSQFSLATLECQWPYKTTISVQENSGSSLTNYQVLLRISGSQLHPNYDWSSAGDDLRILDQDDNTAVPFYIDNWNAANQTAEVWIKLTTLPANSTRNLYLYYGKSDANPLAQVPPVFDRPGIRFHTRRSLTNPTNKQQAFAAFDASNDNNNGYGCKFVTDFTNVTNRDNFGNSRDFIAYSQSYFEVKPSEAGEWSFRYGADFGRGGGIYVDGQPLQEKWNSNLWWAGSWGNTSETLYGSITLAAGYHKIEVIGSEDGNDGGITAQFCKPGSRCRPDRSRDGWQAFATNNIDIRSYSCPIAEPTISFSSSSSCAVDLQLSATPPELWVINSARTLKLNAQNLGPDIANTDSNIQLTLPSNLILDSHSGSDWSCSGSNPVTCSYNQTVAVNASYPMLELQLRATTGSTATINAVLNANGQYDVAQSNNSRSITTSIRQLNLPSGLAAGCSSTPGLLTGYFDTSGSGDFANNSTEFQNNFVSLYANANRLDGYTLLPTVNGSGNPFDVTNNNEKYLTIFDGYIYLPRDGDYQFAVNGDDAVELSLFDSTNQQYTAGWWGGHGALSNAAQTQTPTYQNKPVAIINSGFARGYYRFRFLHQENSGLDSYQAYWNTPDTSDYRLIQASQFVNCNATQNIELVTTTNVISDPINSSNFKAIPGAEVRYQVTARNNGTISTDLDSTVLIQGIDDGSEFLVGSLTFSDGTGNSRSGLQLTPASNISLEYLNASNAVITPASAGTYDPAIRSIRMRFNGTFQAKFGSLTPEFSYQYQIRLQ